MPIYEFICKQCGQQFEEQKKYEDYDADCPLCGSAAEKIMSAPSIMTGKETFDTFIGKDSEKRWMSIQENKAKRSQELFGNASVQDVEQKNSKRISNILQKQNTAMTVINQAKEKLGITKKDELQHALKGR
jgi:putative FmdB family regulatory protein